MADVAIHDPTRSVTKQDSPSEETPTPRRSRQRRLLTKLLVLVSLLLLLTAVLDRVAESMAENKLATIAADAAERYDVNTTDTRVEIVGFGFLPQLIRGEFSSAEVTMRDATITSIPTEKLNISLSGVQVPRSALTTSSEKISVARADVTLRLAPESLAELATSTNSAENLQLKIVDEKLHASVDVAHGTQYTHVTGVVQPTIEQNRIYLNAAKATSGSQDGDAQKFTTQLSSGVTLPELPFGVSLRGISTDGQSVVLTADARDVEL